MLEAIRILTITLAISVAAQAGSLRLQSEFMAVDIDGSTGRWRLLDKRSAVQWPSQGTASAGVAPWMTGEFTQQKADRENIMKLSGKDGASVEFEITDNGRALEIRYDDKSGGTIRSLSDALTITDSDNGYVIVPCREGLLIPADSGKTFKKSFGTSDYEGCHMNMLGFIKSGSALIAAWDDAYVFPEISSVKVEGEPHKQELRTILDLRRSARAVRLMPCGKGDWNTVATAYRQYATKKGLAVTLKEKIRRDPHVELMLGASNAKLWTCLSRKMNEESTAEESVKVRWTFDEAAKIAEHLRNDLEIDRCLFMVGGWTEGGYDVRHPDNLPANPECGGNQALADAVERIQKLGYVGCLHDNVQDMYRDAKSWNPAFIEKKQDGSLITGGRWLGGRAYMVCAPKQLELAKRPQNLPDTHKLFNPWSYFIDTTYAVGPRECYDPNHPIGRNDDIAWKIRLSDYARDTFGVFGSECGREWALPHSDFFEGLVAVSGKYYHNLKPEDFGATVIPFFEMVYHDCQICWGKYGYSAEKASEYVAHHVLCARPLHYHSFGDHLYWQASKDQGKAADGAAVPAIACYTRCDNGWAEGMHPWDVFIKNTHEVLGPLHKATAHQRLSRLEFIGNGRAVRQAQYGQGEGATKVTVNFAEAAVKVATALGGEVVLPQWGFVVESPLFAAFYALRWNGRDYDKGALFALRSADDEHLSRATKVRVFHGFGPSSLNWRGKVYEVSRELVIKAD